MSEQIAAYGAEKERFAVTDEASAEWCLEKLEENAKARALIEEQYQRMIARHEKWRADALAEIDGSDAHLKGDGEDRGRQEEVRQAALGRNRLPRGR